MSNPTLSCEQFAETLADFLERDVAEVTRAAMEAHALGCAECGPLLADLRRLRIDAANLPELAPSRDLWAGIAARIETPVVDLTSRTTSTAGAPIRRRITRGAWLGLAAAGLVAVTATVTHRLTRQSLTSTAPSTVAMGRRDTNVVSPIDSSTRVARQPDATARPATPTQTATPTAIEPRTMIRNASNPVESKPTAEQTYGAEIAGLLVIYDKKQSQLDTATVAVLRKNLQIIDDAIAQCRLALRKDPASRFLLQSLNDALDTKVQLLRTATTLPSRT